MLVAGIGIAPCEGDHPAHTGARLFTVLERDSTSSAMNTRTAAWVMSCGDLFRNPFTAGFIMIPQQHIWQATQDLAATNARVDKEIAALMTARRGTNLLELLRLLNWVAAPSTQHSAARTPWGPQWIQMLAFTDAVDSDLRQKVGLLPTYRPEFIEIRVGDLDANAAHIRRRYPKCLYARSSAAGRRWRSAIRSAVHSAPDRQDGPEPVPPSRWLPMMPRTKISVC